MLAVVHLKAHRLQRHQINPNPMSWLHHVSFLPFPPCTKHRNIIFVNNKNNMWISKNTFVNSYARKQWSVQYEGIWCTNLKYDKVTIFLRRPILSDYPCQPSDNFQGHHLLLVSPDCCKKCPPTNTESCRYHKSITKP